MTQPHSPSSRRMRGFEPASGLLKERIRKAGETRGFAVTRLLTAWPEIVGEATARMTRPVKIGYGRGGLGATLTVLVQPAHAPMIQMQLPQIRDKVNACYGYNAVARIMLTQTAATGFAEGQAEFLPAPKAATPPSPDPEIRAAATQAAAGVADDGLRQALENITRNFLSRSKAQRGRT